METSTPMPSISNDLRRRTLLKNAAQVSPLRKSLNISHHNSSVLEASNDDDERTDRRNQIDIHKRLSNLHHSPSTLNDSFIKDQFIICTHLFSENKITAKNAWKLQIIDMLKPLCQKANKDTLQVASTSIDISAKIYGIRVDDVHSEGLKLAISMAKASERMSAVGDDEESGENEGPEEEGGKVQRKKKKKKRVNLFGKKATVSDSSKSNCGSLQKIEPTEFTIRVNADTGTMENLYTNTLRECCDSFLMLDKTKTMFDDEDTTIKNNENISFSVLPPLPEHVTKINQPFSDFRLDEWDPDHEEKQLGLEKSYQSQSVLQQVIFDDDGIPIPELDGSIHDIFENNDAEADVDLNDDNDDIQSIHDLGAPQLRGGEIARIVDFRAANETAITSEYSYNSIINTRSGQFIDQIWAGPCHWKLKFLRRSNPRFSGQQKSVTSTKEHKQGRKKAEPEMVDFTKKVEIDFSKKLIIKKRPPTVDINKITLPLIDITCAKMLANINELMLKPGAYPLRKKIQKDGDQNQLDYEVSPYKYENPNDSLYCAQSQEDDNGAMDGPMEDHIGSDNEVDEHMNMEYHNLANNMIDNPEMVPKSYVDYALKAKQMDMKNLKAAVWQFLTNTVIDTIDKESQHRRGKVILTTFSEMYRGLPDLLADKERRELSCPLAFVALLHLCNEQNLALKQISTNKDFHIYGPSES